MLRCNLAAVVLLFVFIHSIEPTKFYLYGKFTCPNFVDRKWCVSQKLMEEDSASDDVITDWVTYCIKNKTEMSTKIQGKAESDGWLDHNYEPVLIFKSTCNTSEPGEFTATFKQVPIEKVDATLNVEVVLPSTVIRTSP